MKDRTKNVIIALEILAILILAPVAAYRLWPETVKEIGEGILLVGLIIGLPALAMVSEKPERRDPDTY